MDETDPSSPSGSMTPIELLTRSIGKSVWLITRDNKEYSGTLLGFDEYVNVVLDDAIEYERLDGEESWLFSEEKIGTALLNGNSVEIIVPDSKGPNSRN
jgi:U6 snRNA-associated Sm-like protein LSm5